MSKYIDADALIDRLDYCVKEGMGSTIAFTFKHMVEEAPSIDIVRCKECRWIRYCETEDLDMYLDCDKPDGGGIPRNKDWSCADGERREP